MATFDTLSQLSRMLENLDRWLAAGIACAGQKGFEPDVLATSRLAPDQYTLIQQVQSACDAAKYAASYLSNQKAPSHPDTEKTMAELRARVKACLDYLKTFKPTDFPPSSDLRVSPPWMQGASVRGDAYLMRLAVPNFYFHVTTAYAILRHNGVPLGKGDYIGVTDWSEPSKW
jgi:hypothetical protein